MVFQNPDNQLIATTVEEDVALAPKSWYGSQHNQERLMKLKISGNTWLKEKGPHLYLVGKNKGWPLPGLLLCALTI